MDEYFWLKKRSFLSGELGGLGTIKEEFRMSELKIDIFL